MKGKQRVTVLAIIVTMMPHSRALEADMFAILALKPAVGGSHFLTNYILIIIL